MPAASLLMQTLILLSSTYISAAAAAMTTEEVALRIEKFALEQVNGGLTAGAPGAPVWTLRLAPDKRALAPCLQVPLLAALDLRQRGRLRFTLSCPDAGAGAWRREYVVRATLSALVLVTVRPVPAGAAIGAADVVLARRDITAIDDSLASPAAAQGKSSRRALRDGEMLRGGQLRALPLVRRGQAVRIVARGAQVEASMAGEALDDGAAGALVRVRNTSSGSVIRARVLDGGTVAPLLGPGAD